MHWEKLEVVEASKNDFTFWKEGSYSGIDRAFIQYI